MSVDLTQLTAHLSPQQQETVRKAYKKQAENETAAFLLCFFLGLFGAHRLYLHQWGRGLLHLVVPVAIAAVIAGGLLTGLNPAIIALVAIPLLIIGLVWMFIDLFRIDTEVAARNLQLAEQLIAQTLLADRSIDAAVQSRLDQLTREVSTGSAPAEAAAASVAAAGTVAAIDYAATTVTQISAEPEPQQQAETAAPDTSPDNWTTTEHVREPAVSTDASPAGMAAPQPAMVDTVVRSHSESAFSATDSVETYHTVMGEEPAAAGAAASTANDATYHTVMGEDPGAPNPAPAANEPAPTPAQSEAATWPDHPPIPPIPPIAPADLDAAAGLGALGGSAGMAVSGARDATDLAPADAGAAPVADVGTAGATPLRVRLDDAYAFDTSQDTPPVVPIPVRPAYDEPEPPADALLTLVPESSAGVVAPELAADAYLPPTVPVYDAAATTPAYEPPVEPVEPGEPMGPAPTASERTHPTGETLAELAGYGAVAGALAEAAHASEEPPVWPVPDALPDAAAAAAADTTQDLPSPASSSASSSAPAPDVVHDTQVTDRPHHMLKRIRVVRQIKMGDQIVEESAAEEYIEPDADPEPVKERLREKLRREAEERQQGGPSAP
ncbi:MAG TPA: NINE protein [Ktedonobacterales bacterium]|nr:NINE protein [Ktedonobacterales bacterium]